MGDAAMLLLLPMMWGLLGLAFMAWRRKKRRRRNADCQGACQYGQDVGMPEQSCYGECYYAKCRKNL